MRNLKRTSEVPSWNLPPCCSSSGTADPTRGFTLTPSPLAGQGLKLIQGYRPSGLGARHIHCVICSKKKGGTGPGRLVVVFHGLARHVCFPEKSRDPNFHQSQVRRSTPGGREGSGDRRRILLFMILNPSSSHYPHTSAGTPPLRRASWSLGSCPSSTV